MGERKIALFCCIPDSDKSLNYLVGMIYTQLIQTLYRQADRVHKGRLPVPVHCLMDEYANISLPKDTFLSALATMRSRAIFCSIIVQNMAQLKAMYKDDWESLVGLCDEFLYLGGTEKETHKYVSELLGKETISTTSYNQSKGRSGSYSINHQQSGRDLMTPDEVRLLDNSKCILFIRGERPVIDLKYNLLKHPNIRYTEDGGAAPYDYTAADNARDDLPGAPDNYELLDIDDFSARRSGRDEANHTKNQEAQMKLNHNKKSVKISLNLFALYAVMVCGVVFALPAFAADDPLVVVVKSLHFHLFADSRRRVLSCWGGGIVQVGLSLQSHDPSQRSQGFLTLAGGWLSRLPRKSSTSLPREDCSKKKGGDALWVSHGSSAT